MKNCGNKKYFAGAFTVRVIKYKHIRLSRHTVLLGSTSANQEQEGKSSETDPIKFKISSKTSRGKKDSTKDTIIDITSDSQVNSNFPNRWSQASLTFNNYFYLFLYLYIT